MRNSRAFEVSKGSHSDVFYCDNEFEARELFVLNYVDLKDPESIDEHNKEMKRLHVKEVTE